MAEIAFAAVYILKFSGGACRTPLKCLTPSALTTCPPQNYHPSYATECYTKIARESNKQISEKRLITSLCSVFFGTGICEC